ncbi:hypothetical protein AGLY_013421 [Aphis glycines]|uniref:G-protein coupled receptors family 1 profile domain-containing protein n=1 Tax=Aphis glycines TaxID=307491 RepID=A0A6G0T744_APHGL|nr:hypothetical protein AGLY_013421 [Aphis glycines]
MVIEPGLMDMLGNSLFDMLAPVSSTESSAVASTVSAHGSGDGSGGRVDGSGSAVDDDEDDGSGMGGGSGAGGSGGIGPGELWYRHSPAMTAVYCFAYTMVFLVGLVGNLLVVSVVCRSPRMRNVTNYFIVNLAVADILVLVFCLPATLLSNIYVHTWPVLCTVSLRPTRTCSENIRQVSLLFDETVLPVKRKQDRFTTG